MGICCIHSQVIAARASSTASGNLACGLLPLLILPHRATPLQVLLPQLSSRRQPQRSVGSRKPFLPTARGCLSTTSSLIRLQKRPVPAHAPQHGLPFSLRGLVIPLPL